MVMTNPITDLLTRIRGTNAVRHEVVEVPSSNVKKAVANVLSQEEYIRELEEYNDGVIPMLRISLRYSTDKEGVVAGIKKIPKPELRVYCKKDKIPKVLSGLEITMISASTGLLVDKEARRAGLDGEVIYYVW